VKYLVEIDGHQHEVEILPARFLVDGNPLDVDIRRIGDLPIYSMLVNNESAEASVEETSRYQYHVMLGGEMYALSVQPAARAAVAAKPARRASESVLRAPMPGLVAAIQVDVGQAVKAGAVLVVLESMKMENPLAAPIDGQVTQVHVGPRQSVEKGQLLVTLSPPES